MIPDKEILRQWNAEHGPAYQLRFNDLHWNQQKQNLIAYSFHEVAGTPVMTAAATQVGIAAGIPVRNLWLSLWGKIENHQQFATELKVLTKKIGKVKTVIGGDEFHLTPSLPLSPSGLKLQQALRESKFQGEEVADYFGDINSSPVSEYIATARDECEKRGLTFDDVLTPTDVSTAETFLGKEFPGRWTREFKFWAASREETQRTYWKLLRTKEREVIGFARMAVRGRAVPLEKYWTPGALRMPTQLERPTEMLNSDCSLGPIGVASSQRGRGTGKVLLGLVLESLRNSPTEKICIDWTNAFKYYEPLQFIVARRYWASWYLEE